MRRFSSGLHVLLCVQFASLAALSHAAAQDTPAHAGAAEPESGSEAKAAPMQPPPRISYDEYRRSELAFLAKRSRIALFSTSAAAAVGVALVTPAFVNECVRVASSSSFDDVRCSSTGRALLGVGIPLLAAGALGVVISGTILGVRKGKIRHIENRLAYEKSHAVRWDPTRLAFVF